MYRSEIIKRLYKKKSFIYNFFFKSFSFPQLLRRFVISVVVAVGCSSRQQLRQRNHWSRWWWRRRRWWRRWRRRWWRWRSEIFETSKDQPSILGEELRSKPKRRATNRRTARGTAVTVTSCHRSGSTETLQWVVVVVRIYSAAVSVYHTRYVGQFGPGRVIWMYFCKHDDSLKTCFLYKEQIKTSHHEHKIKRVEIYFFKFRSKVGGEHLTTRKRIKANATIHVCIVRGVPSLLKGGLDKIKLKKRLSFNVLQNKVIS